MKKLKRFNSFLNEDFSSEGSLIGKIRNMLKEIPEKPIKDGGYWATNEGPGVDKTMAVIPVEYIEAHDIDLSELEKLENDDIYGLDDPNNISVIFNKNEDTVEFDIPEGFLD